MAALLHDVRWGVMRNPKNAARPDPDVMPAIWGRLRWVSQPKVMTKV